MTTLKPIIYIIRHGEKPPKNPDGSDPPGLSAMGLQRAQGVRTVFGVTGPYNIGYTMAQKPKNNGMRARPYLTIKPLSEDLGITPNKNINRDDHKEAADAAKAFDGPGNVLFCWEHHALTDIVREIGVPGKHVYPSDRFDIIWAIREPYTELEWVGSMNIPGLDTLPPNMGDGSFGALPSTNINGVVGLAVDPVKPVTNVVVSVEEIPTEIV